MRDLNKIFLLGRLGSDPTLRSTKTGLSVTTFALATSRPKKEEEPEEAATESPAEGGQSRPPEETVWHRIVVWGRQGENCHQFLKKGSQVMVEGSVRSRKYQASDGTDKYAFEVHAEAVRFLSGGKRTKASEQQEEPVLAAAEA